jgi:hypothetical protein
VGTVKPTPPDTATWADAVTHGYFGERTDPFPDEIYNVESGDAYTGPPPSPPTVSDCSPATGPVAGGTPVTITGTGLTGCFRVYFGTWWVTDVTVVDANTVTCSTPPADFPATMGVSAETPLGRSAEWSSFTYTAAEE